MMTNLGWNHPCKPQKLGAKHREQIIRQLGETCRPYVEASCVLGRFWLCAKPEHWTNTPKTRAESDALFEATGSREYAWSVCPFCGSRMFENDSSNVMTAMRCAGCDRFAWFYCDSLDAMVNEYDVSWVVTVEDRRRAIEERGIPAAVFL